MYDYQPAPLMKRVSAFMLDMMLLVSCATGIIFGLSALTGYDSVNESYHELIAGIAEEYDFNIEMTSDENYELTEDEQAVYAEKQELVNTAISESSEAMHAYLRLTSLMIMNLSLGILGSCLIFEFAVPLIIGNGMTIGKKTFGIAVVRTDMVRVQPVQMFVRAILGKYTVEIMIPVLLAMMIMFGSLGTVGIIVILGLGLIQVVLYSVTGKYQFIHGVISSTCTCNYASQAIFRDAAERDAYNSRK